FSVSVLLLLRLPRSTLFPYTTLFRSLPPGGPVLNSFVKQINRLEAHGGTPLSPTLHTLAPTLLSFEDQTAIVLITDGAPNCNDRSEEHTSELQSRENLVCRLLLEKKK